MIFDENTTLTHKAYTVNSNTDDLTDLDNIQHEGDQMNNSFHNRTNTNEQQSGSNIRKGISKRHHAKPRWTQ